jgi:hypothetical protein
VTAPDRARVAGLLWGFFPAQVLQTLAALGVPDALAAGPLATDALGERTGTDPDALHRLLRAASGLGLLDHDGHRWSLTPDGTLLVGGAPGSVGNLARLFCGDAVWRAWGELEWSVRTGRPSLERLTGRSAFEHLAADPALLAVFTEAMAEATRAAAPGVVACCDLDGVRTIVDVGGGNGTLLAAFLDAHPALRATLLDTPDTVAGRTDLPDRATAVAGDFFTCVPTADAHVLKSVIHDWDDERSVAILTRVREAMPPHGRLFLVEPVLAETVAGLAEQRVTVMSDLNMLVCTGGRERTRAEFTALLDAAGLRIVEVTRVPPPTGFSVLRAVRA